MFLTEKVLKKMKAKIKEDSNSDYFEIKLPLNEGFHVSFFTKTVPLESKDIDMIFLHKGRNNSVSIPIYKGRFIYEELDKDFIKVLEDVKEFFFNNKVILSFKQWKKNNKLC